MFALEAAKPQPGAGPEKKDQLMSTVDKLIQTASSATTATGHEDAGNMLAAIGEAADVLVPIFHKHNVGPFAAKAATG
jgi:hypothetical protein